MQVESTKIAEIVHSVSMAGAATVNSCAISLAVLWAIAIIAVIIAIIYLKLTNDDTVLGLTTIGIIVLAFISIFILCSLSDGMQKRDAPIVWCIEHAQYNSGYIPIADYYKNK